MEVIDLYAYEKKYARLGKKNIAGCDEAGRGPMAGPLVVGMVVLNPKKRIEGLNDSKKLTEKKREELYPIIIKKAKDVRVAIFNHDEVDMLNVYEASRLGMIKCVKESPLNIDFVLTDAMPLRDETIEHEAIIKGDQKSATIAAASIIAKVTRDRIMRELALKYPEYGFEKHKGYVTTSHLKAIEKYGICEEHRLSFEPVKRIINKRS